MNLELLDRAAGATTCNILQLGGGALVQAGAVGIVGAGVGFVPLAAGAAMLLAANYGCGEMPLGDAEDSMTTGCIQVESVGDLFVTMPSGDTFLAFPPGNVQYTDGRRARRITKAYVLDTQSGSQPYFCMVEWEGPNGEQFGSSQYKFSSMEQARKLKWSIDPVNGDCTATSPDTKPLPPEIFEPQPYTDVITNCNYTVQLQGFAEEQPGGAVQPVYLIEGVTDERAGGRMGGCNFPPTIYSPNFGGPGRYLPMPPGGPPPNGPGGVPWWAGPVLGGAVGAALKLIGDEIARMSEPDVNEGSFVFTAPCDVDENGVAASQLYEFERSSFNQRLLNHQIALMDMLQQHLNWKTPTCGDNDKPELEGDWRTVSFRSDETSPYGKSRLRKRFRYRSQSEWTDDAIINHWRDFVWQSGPVIVQHSGSSWGTPQVWAATADEGKRVIRHAAGEAGIDPDQVGRWTISGSRGSRYGVSDTMRVETKGGFYWITARDGSDARPLVAKVPHPYGSGVDITEIDYQ